MVSSDGRDGGDGGGWHRVVLCRVVGDLPQVSRAHDNALLAWCAFCLAVHGTQHNLVLRHAKSGPHFMDGSMLDMQSASFLTLLSRAFT